MDNSTQSLEEWAKKKKDADAELKALRRHPFFAQVRQIRKTKLPSGNERIHRDPFWSTVERSFYGQVNLVDVCENEHEKQLCDKYLGKFMAARHADEMFDKLEAERKLANGELKVMASYSYSREPLSWRFEKTIEILKNLAGLAIAIPICLAGLFVVFLVTETMQAVLGAIFGFVVIVIIVYFVMGGS